jgi:hypothetical protein
MNKTVIGVGSLTALLLLLLVGTVVERSRRAAIPDQTTPVITLAPAPAEEGSIEPSPPPAPTPLPIGHRSCPYKYRVSQSLYEVHALANRSYEAGRVCDDVTQAFMEEDRRLGGKGYWP